jgi:hypothetical protein
MEGTITNIEDKNGKIRVAVDGKWYGTSKCKPDPGQMVRGLRIQFEGNSWEYQGKTFWGINKWKAIGEAQHPSGQPAQNAQGRPQGGSTVTDGDILRSVSNVLGNACAAGTIKSPEELVSWFVPAYNGFMFMAQWAQRDQRQGQAPASGGHEPESASREYEFDDTPALNGPIDENVPPW